jgi:hypothetical protein
MRKLLFVFSLVALAPIVSACASASAKTKPAERPPLSVPPPPPRVIEPAPQPDPVPEPVADLPPPPTPSRTSTRQPREASPKQEPAKQPETKAGEAPVTETPAPAATTPQPPPQLRTPQTADASEAEKNVRSTIDRASKLLGGVNYGPLNNERKKAYNDAKMFIQQAEEASKQGNFALAQGVANKAETLARELAGR